jgi:signal transduction histidine kinase/DNA-binding response OmpR family regulator
VDLTTLFLEGLFGFLFLSTLSQFVRRRDALSRDVMLIFGSMAMLFLLAGVSALVGTLPDWVNGIGIGFLLAQPFLTLRLADRVSPIPRWVMRGAAFAFGLVALPLAVLPRPMQLLWVLGGVVVFVVTDLLAAYYLARDARRRVGSARWRLAAAATGSAMLALAILVAMVGRALPIPPEAASAASRTLALGAAIGFLVAFLPPRWLRRVWNALASSSFTNDLMDVPADAVDEGVWQRLADLAQHTTGAQAVAVVAGQPGSARVGAVVADPIVAEVIRGADISTVPTASTRTDALGELFGAPVLSVLALQLVDGAPGALLLYQARPSLFAADDHDLLDLLLARATVFADRGRAIREQVALTGRLAATVQALEQASKAKSDFLASMSHELRTPLSAVIGFSALMLEEPLEGTNRTVPDEWIGHIHRSGDHLLGLINDVLDLTKIEAGRIELKPEDFDLGAALNESTEGLRPLSERKSISVEVVSEPGSITADRGRLRQIIYNLLSNAIKFTPDNGRIRIEAGWDGDDAHIAVTDTGVGIAEEDLERIFEEFSQVGDQKAREAGTGLGLALSRRLAEAHGGHLLVSSQPGAGSRFELVMPGSRAHATARTEPVRTTNAEGEGEGEGATILVIEDEPGAVRLLRAYLEGDGHQVQVATDGESGIELARAMLPAAIVLDVLLPGIDGWEVLRRLKVDPDLRDIPVVVVTVVDERNVAMTLGAADYFLKPIRPDALLSRLAQYTFTTKVKQRNVCVLAIDDDPAASALVENALRPEGFQVMTAGSGREGLAMAHQCSPDLVICDLLMPDMDGYEVVDHLHASDATRDTMILILTAADLSEADRQRLNGKVAGIVHKNGDPRNALAEWLDRASAAARRRETAMPR